MEIIQEQLYKDIESAYRKYKHFVYRDTTFPLLREQLASFEASSDSNLEKEFTDLYNILRGFNNPNKLRQWLNEIDYWLLPKSINPTLPISDTFLTNETIVENIEIQKDFALINAPIQIHIISILWIMKGGYLLENAMIIKPFANRLELNEDKNRLLGGFALFQPYHKLYQNWRDKAFDKAIQLVEEEKDVLILSLDVKDYFPSMQVDFEQIAKDIYETQSKMGRDTYDKEFFDFLTTLLKKIQEKYEDKIITEEVRKSYGLPIGLMSSAVIANWYLKEFDEKVSEIVNPAYYGRYVDDILMVIPNPKMPKKEKIAELHGPEKEVFIKEEIFKWYFERYDNEIIKHDKKNKSYQILLAGKEDNLRFQDEKIKFILFNHKEPIALLHKFRKELKIESSEFRLLPEEMNINDEFYSEAHFLAFDGSNNKLRNITGFGVDLFGASKFLAKKIYSALQADREIDEIASKQILTFFKGARAIESVKLWEKVATYFIATKDKKNLIRFIKNIQEAIKNISDKSTSPKQEYKHSSKIKKSLTESLAIAVSTALALEGVININYGKKDEQDKTKKAEYGQNDEKIIHLLGMYEIDKTIIAFRKSNMIRHSFIKLPLINYTKLSKNDEGMKISYLDIDLIPEKIDKSNYEDLELDLIRFNFSPRYIHFHEIAFSIFRKQLLVKSERLRDNGNDRDYISFEEKREERKEEEKKKEETQKDYNYIEEAQKMFEQANAKISLKYKIKFEYKPYSRFSEQNKEGEKLINAVEIKKITIEGTSKKERMRVGLVNLKLDDRHIKESYLKNPIFDKNRKEDINHLLNLIEKETWKHGKLDIIVLPEVSIPYKALSWLCHYALQHDVIMVFGLEHWIINSVAFNFMVTLLPFKIKNTEENIDGYKAILPVFRIKNHYSHEEKCILESYGYIVPKLSPQEYHIFDWKGINFATFNCFELADIKHRAMFRDEVDLIVASENNRDTNYFSNIMESYLRDLHCYVIQANNSKYGDTRISKPFKSTAMDQVKIKGGINAAVLIDEIDIKALRDFQIQEFLCNENKEFKPTPPGFDRQKAMKRRGKNLNE